MANTVKEVKEVKKNARRQKLILLRTKNANAKGRYFQFSEGYDAGWKPQAKLLEADGKLFITNGKMRLIDVDIDAVRAELKAKASEPKAPKKARKTKAPKVEAVAQTPAVAEQAPAVEQAPVTETPAETPAEVIVPTDAPAVEQPAVETQAPVAETERIAA